MKTRYVCAPRCRHHDGRGRCASDATTTLGYCDPHAARIAVLSAAFMRAAGLAPDVRATKLRRILVGQRGRRVVLVAETETDGEEGSSRE